ncbi:glycosyltransferase family 4 protein [Vreelandella salicampi]|uniref:Glycosyltransferase family 4 protein n=1 Tax=Vreelandella salicampi TaxID=1449798 RepID=A0A7Z0RUC8_9GAMM|nr:glycosyltransferase family 4 protein [Halomonas salicampi]NYS60354.1 glycosyltransferase family 4 protein [Halomonas salicampi]
MKIALVAPSGVPFAVGGAEKLWWGLLHHTNQLTDHQMELIKLPSPERNFAELMTSYERFSQLDLSHFDRVISTKYPAWMVGHPEHYLYLQHTLRGLYDTYPWPGRAAFDAFSPNAWPGDKSRRAIRLLRHHPDIRRLRRLLAARPEREQLPELFACVNRLLQGRTLPRRVSDKLFVFPGPLSRAVIHHLDAIATAPGAITSYAAISQNVTRRAHYFPRGVPVKVIHHPSDLAWPETPTEAPSPTPYFFTVSRLDAPKRLDLLVRAFLRTEIDAQLWIAGTGPMAETLKTLAADDARVRFLGFVRDSDVARLYQHALAVPFLPFDEDYGLITVEAMQAGKPVITTRDAGGVNEFVRHGETGWCVAPEPDALAEALTEAASEPAKTHAMGVKARRAVAHVTWPDTVRELIEALGTSLNAHFPTVKGLGAGAHWLVLNTFPVYPPMGGGQSRMFHFYRHVASELGVKVTLLVLAPENSGEQCREIAPGLWEHRIPLSPEQAQKQRALNKALEVPVDDIAAVEGFRDNPRFIAMLKYYAPQATLGVCAHPYLVHAMGEYVNAPFWYEAHNVESRLKRTILTDALAQGGDVAVQAHKALAAVENAEQRACVESEEIIACAEGDLIDFRHAYALPANKGQVVPNCADLTQLPFIDVDQRLRWQQRLQQTRPVALFLGSWHGPNLEAADFICQTLAPACPEVVFLLAGSLCDHPQYRHLPPNVRALGRVSDRELKVLLASVSVALNPMFSGSGSNLKMLDYTASGVPVLTTAFGNRGLDFSEQAVWIAEQHDWPRALRELLDAPQHERHAHVALARERTEEVFSWPLAVRRLADCHS